MSQNFEVESPIINSPFCEPRLHWQIERAKPPVRAPGRRRASYFYRVPEHAGRGRKNKPRTDLFEASKGEQVDLGLVNEIRERVKKWRQGIHSAGLPYDGASSITKELLELWRGEDRMQRLFFAQIEAVETLIFLVEANEIYRKGLPAVPSDEPGPEAKAAGIRAFVRYACKMATGTGKTTVMGMLAAWAILNRVASPTDNRFSDTILIVCPNVTIRERLQELTPLTTPEGALAAYGPGEKPILSLKDWRALFRDQQVAFKLARQICVRWQADNGAAAVPVQVLFPKVAFAAKRFLVEKLDRKGGSQPCDVLLVGEYMQAAIGTLLKVIKKGSSCDSAEVAVIPRGASGRGSTLFVDFHTTKPIYPVTKCHLNVMVADTQKWEQSAAFLLDSHPGVKKWVKNDRLGFFIPYRKKGLPARYVPDFIVETDNAFRLIVEIKGQQTDDADVKTKAAQRWVNAVNRLGNHGAWHYLLVTDPGSLGNAINPYTTAKWDEGLFEFE